MENSLEASRLECAVLAREMAEMFVGQSTVICANAACELLGYVIAQQPTDEEKLRVLAIAQARIDFLMGACGLKDWQLKKKLKQIIQAPVDQSRVN